MRSSRASRIEASEPLCSSRPLRSSWTSRGAPLNSIVVVGDAHGQADLLGALLAHDEVRNRFVVTTGDMVNVGSNSRGTLDLLVECDAGSRLAYVAGNHERELLHFLDGGPFIDLALVGGIPTIKSYVGLARGDVRAQLVSHLPLTHLDLLRRTVAAFETDEVIVSHCGIDPMHPDARDAVTMTSGHASTLFKLEWNIGKLVICGHYPQSGGRPFVSERLVCLDTGAGLGGPLTALLLPERRALQAERNGKVEFIAT